jgi:glycosyltransferase involved in cell wall biosynthesis
MGLLFYPRGGSAHVARNLATALPQAGWDATLVSGSVTLDGHPGDARRFYAPLDVRPVDMTHALESRDPMAADPPLHPSYEDRPGAPDRIFAALDDRHAEHLARAWSRELEAAGAADADVLHLNHLTPLNEAAARVAPDVPVVGHLHGTELLMLEAIRDQPDRWAHGAAWAERLRGWAQRCDRLLILSTSADKRAEPLLGLGPERFVQVPNGFNPERFRPLELDRGEFWAEQLPALAGHDGPVLLYVGRFTAVKRVPLLIEAYAQAQAQFRERAPLVLVGGFPDETEGEHPADAIARTGAEDVHLAGWHEPEQLSRFLNAADAVVLPSVAEQFGQVIVEGMACARPAIAVDAHGPAEIVDDGETGWLIPGDDRDALAAALLEAVNEPEERTRRGANARQVALERYAWPALAERVAAVYEAALTAKPSTRGQTPT